MKVYGFLVIFNYNNEINIENDSNEYYIITTGYTNELYMLIKAIIKWENGKMTRKHEIWK